MIKSFHLVLAALFFLISSTTGSAQPTKTKGLMFTTSSNEALMTFREGLKYNDIGDSKKARMYFQKAIEQDSKFAIAYVYRAMYTSTPQEFVYFLQKAKENLSNTNDWEKLMYEYIETELKNDMDKRLSLAQRMVTDYPEGARAYVYLGNAYAGRSDYAKARQNYQKAVLVDPNWPGGYTALVNSYLFEPPKDFKQAENSATKLVSLAPATASFILLGDVYRAENDLRKAQQMYSRAVQTDPESPTAFLKRGHAYTFLGEYDKARSDYQEAKALDVTPIMSLQFNAFTYLYQGQPEQALDQLMKDAENVSQNVNEGAAASAKFNLLSMAAMVAFHIRDAQKLQEIIMAMEPLSVEMGTNVGTMEAAQMQKAGMLYWEGIVKALNKDFAGATMKADELKAAVQAIKSPRKLEDYEALMGTISMLQNNYKDAVSHFSKTDNTNVYNRYCLAKAYEGSGQKDKANKIYKEIAIDNFNTIGFALIRNELKGKM